MRNEVPDEDCKNKVQEYKKLGNKKKKTFYVIIFFAIIELFLVTSILGIKNAEKNGITLSGNVITIQYRLLGIFSYLGYTYQYEGYFTSGHELFISNQGKFTKGQIILLRVNNFPRDVAIIGYVGEQVMALVFLSTLIECCAAYSSIRYFFSYKEYVKTRSVS